jgi:hypothetical protein
MFQVGATGKEEEEGFSMFYVVSCEPNAIFICVSQKKFRNFPYFFSTKSKCGSFCFLLL